MLVILGDCPEVMKRMDAESVDAIVTDPPYGLSFMGKGWDHGVPGIPYWQECLRVSKPGAHMLAFGGTRTHHRLMVAIEDAGWEIRDTMGYLYGSGFPKSLNISKALDKTNGVLFDGTAIVELKNKLILLFNNSGKTRGEIDAECGFRACNYLTLPKDGKRPDPWINILPSQEKWVKIKKVLGCEEDSNELVVLFKEAEREVIGHLTKARAVGSKSALPTLGASVEYQTWDITAPTTDAAKQWDGWGTALKPAWEPIILCRKPLCGTVAANVLKHGVGGLNIDGCRVPVDPTVDDMSRTVVRKVRESETWEKGSGFKNENNHLTGVPEKGRFPANIIHDGSNEVLALFPQSSVTGKRSDSSKSRYGQHSPLPLSGESNAKITEYTDSGSAARFFYCAKASRSERGIDNKHPTVKPLALMRYLCRLITPPGGLILDPFAGSGSTGVAAKQEGFQSILIELEQESYETANARMRNVK